MPNTITTLKMRGALHTCSYEEEVEAMKMATSWVKEYCNITTSIMIGTDIQSLCMAIEALNPETEPIKKDLINHRARIVVQWIPGHSGTMGNEWADVGSCLTSQINDVIM